MAMIQEVGDAHRIGGRHGFSGQPVGNPPAHATPSLPGRFGPSEDFIIDERE